MAKYNGVKLTVELNLILSEKGLKDLNKDSMDFVLRNCFKNNSRVIKSVQHGVIDDGTHRGNVWDG